MLVGWLGPPQAECNEVRLREIAACHFNVVPPPCEGGHPDGNRAILELCSELGLKAIVADSRLGPDHWETARDAAQQVRLDYNNHPAIYGFVLDDEPPTGRFEQLAAVSDAVRDQWPAAHPLVCLLPNWATPEQLGTESYTEHVARYLDTVRPSLFLFDHYALFNEWENVALLENLATVRQLCAERDVRWGMALNSVAHFDYREPGEADLRWQAFSAIAYGARAIIYYTYWTPPADFEAEAGYGDALMDRHGRPTSRYFAAQRVNADIVAWAPLLVKLRSLSVHYDGQTQGEPPVTVASDGPTLVGIFEHEDDPSCLYAFVVNHDSRRRHSVAVTLHGKRSAIDVRTGASVGDVLDLAAGDAVLIQLFD